MPVSATNTGPRSATAGITSSNSGCSGKRNRANPPAAAGSGTSTTSGAGHARNISRRAVGGTLAPCAAASSGPHASIAGAGSSTFASGRHSAR